MSRHAAEILVPVDLYFIAALAVVEVVGRLPSPVRLLATRSLGAISSTLSRRKRRAIVLQLQQAFPDMDGRAHALIARASMTEFWRESQFAVPSVASEAARKAGSIRGLEHLERAHAGGRGVILAESSGFGRRALARAALHHAGYVAHQIHGPNHLGVFHTPNAETTWLRNRIRRFLERRERHFVHEILTIPREPSTTFGRAALARLKANAILLTQGDGRQGENLLNLPFLGGPCLFAPGTAKIAVLSGAPILPIFGIDSDPGPSRVEIEAPLVCPENGSRSQRVQEILRDYAARLEARVRTSPEQYRNWHLLRRPRETR